MKIVVTGAAGFIGSHLSEALVGRGHDVVGLDCFTDYYARADKESNLVALRAHDRFEFVEADLRTDALEAILDGADAIVNEAATPGLVLSWDRFEQYATCNLSAVQRLADAAVRVGIDHFVQASTSSVYGAEDADTHPVSPYGVTKLAAEQLLDAYRATAGLPVTVLRYFSVYGPRQRPDMAYRIFCERMLAGEPIEIYGDGLQSRGITFVEDCVAGTVAALERPDLTGTFNIGGGTEISLNDALAILAGALDVEVRAQHLPARRGDQRRTVPNCTKATAQLGWAPEIEPEEGLARQAAWVRSRRDAGRS